MSFKPIYTRRQFLKVSTALGIAGVAACNATAENGGPPAVDIDNFKLPTIALGATEISCSMLGIGTGTHGWGGASEQTRLGKSNLITLLEYAYDRSVTFFDLADQYGSHEHMRAALKENGGSIPREKVMLLTKTHASTADEMRADLDRFRKEVGTDYFDVMLLHCETSASWNKSHAGAMEVLSEAREKGIVRAHGVSCHSLSALKTAAAEPWVQVDLARYNPWGRNMDGSPEAVTPVLQEMKQAQKGVIGMKLLANGNKASDSAIDSSLRFTLSSGLIDCFTIGMTSRGQVDGLLKHLMVRVGG